MLRKLIQYRKIVGDAIRLSRQNGELLSQLQREAIGVSLKNNELLYQLREEIIGLSRQNSELLSQLQREATGVSLKNNELLYQLREEMHHDFTQHDLQARLRPEIVAVNTATFEKYKNVHTGMDVAILAAGPTLNRYIPLENTIHIGVNRVCKNRTVPLEYYFAQDFGLGASRTVSYEDDIVNLACKKFFGVFSDSLYGKIEPSESLCARTSASRYFVDHSPSEHLHVDIRFHPLSDFFSVVFPALSFALFTNPRKVYLVGCDTSYGGYFSNETQNASVGTMRYNLIQNIIGYRKYKEFIHFWYPETEVISINPVNLKGMFRDMVTDEHGVLDDCPDSSTDRDFSDLGIEDIVNRHMEQVLLDRLCREYRCRECGQSSYSLLRGLSDDARDTIEVKCDGCGTAFSYPEGESTLRRTENESD